MKIIILSDANSVHTLKWVISLKEKNFNLLLFSLFKPNDQIAKKYDEIGITVKSMDLNSKIKNVRKPNLSKINYISSFFPLKKIIKNFNPDLLHAHYASSYGVLAYLIGFKPYILSVWGSDILDFPYKNFINKWLINKTVQSANVVCSTSNIMREILINEYNRLDTKLVPFGVDINLFSPQINKSKVFTVGTIKSIEEYNGIDCLLDAADIIVNQYNEENIHYLIVGKGSLLNEMKEKTINLGLQKYVKFTGAVSYQGIEKYHNKLSVFVAISKRESFGVAVLEALACSVPAITSNVGGLPEVNQNQLTGKIIDPNNPRKLADSIMKFYLNEDYRIKLGENGRNWVVKKYNWDKNVDQMINIYYKNQ